jgi:serine/threonine-protein kinase
MGAVYRALQMPLGREVALKVIRSAAPPDESLRLRFFREARFLSRMSNRRIAMVLDYGEEPNELLYMVLEYVRGGSLRAALKTAGAFEVPRALQVLDHVLEALQEAHAAGLVHRDLKPSNIMLRQGPDGTEEARLLDFGVAKHVGGDEAELTASGAAVGTPAYMSPEQVNQQSLTPAADVYAATCVLYALLTGRPPYEGSTYEVLRACVNAPPPELPTDLEVPAGLREVMDRGLSKAPSERYADARALRRALRAVMGVAPETPLPSGPTPTPGWEPTPPSAARSSTPELAGATLTASTAPPVRPNGGPRLVDAARSDPSSPPEPSAPAGRRRWTWLGAPALLGVLVLVAARWSPSGGVSSAPQVDPAVESPAAALSGTPPSTPTTVVAPSDQVAALGTAAPSTPRADAGVPERPVRATPGAQAVQRHVARTEPTARADPPTAAPRDTPTAAPADPPTAAPADPPTAAPADPPTAAATAATPASPLNRRPRTFGVAPPSQP